MSPARPPQPRPPEWADELLRHAIPSHGETDAIIGDLHQEFEEQLGMRSLNWLKFRYSAHAVEIALRYSLLRVKELSKHSGGEVMGSFIADLKYGVRMLVRTPVLTITGALTFALGVALTTHAFSAVYGTMIRPPSVDPNGDLTFVQQTWPERNIPRIQSLPIHDFERFRDQQTSFNELAGYYQTNLNMAGEEASPERFLASVSTANLLRVAGVAPHLGRVHTDGEEGPGSPRLVVLGYEAWENRFARDPNILGTSIRLNSIPYEIIGVMPEGFGFPFQEKLWITHEMEAAAIEPRGGIYLHALGRLKPGTTQEIAQSELSAIQSRIVAEFPETHAGIGATMQSYMDRYMPEPVRALLWLMLGAVGGVLLISSANVANLLLARATLRTREVALRTALGANRTRVIRQLLVESALLGLVGGLIGLALAHLGIVWFNNAILDIQKPYWIDVRLDGVALAFTLCITLASAVVAGVVPALKASGGGLGAILQDESRGSTSLRLGRFSSALVVTELAVSCALLVGAGLMTRSVMNLKTMDMGFDGADVTIATVVLPENDYPLPSDRDLFWSELVSRLESEPGVANVALSDFSPGTGSQRIEFSIEGATYAQDSDYPRTNASVVSADYHATYGISLLQGREMTEAEWRLDGDPVALVSASFAEHFFPGEEAIGKRIRTGRADSPAEWMTVVGIVDDVYTGSGDLGGLGASLNTPYHLYMPVGQAMNAGAIVGMKATGDPTALAQVVRQVIQSMDSDLPVFNIGTAEQALETANWSFNLFGSLFGAFGLVALFLAAVGLYGVMAFSVSQRRKEMGVRMALGADPTTILGLIVRRGATQLAIGLGAGLALGALASRPLGIALLGVDALDPVVYASITLTLGGTGLIATLVPALRATRVDPNTALRPE